ncbi:hypothetical protein [Salinibacter altiplanensis]|uniref:hypothetical protein n=1 Tax=Salinibacter altiplanensis TaxID=1803181 RepID=UPI000C9F8B0E|nr:hypothetical protein [Salinibacter altiplanensis]
MPSRSLLAPIRHVRGGASRLAYGLLLGVLSAAALLLAAGADPGTRAAGLRLWALAGAGMFAVAPPNVLFPDPNVSMLQRLNRTPAGLLRYQARRLGPLVLLAVGPAVLVAYGDSGGPLQHLGAKTVALGQALLLIGGTALDSFVHFATLGARSQAWHEGRAGQWYARAVEEQGQGISLPRGLVPALFATTRCFVVGVGVVIATAAAATNGLAVWAWVPGLLLVGWAGVRLRQSRPAYDRHFYHTTAFYAEVMGGGTVAATDRAPVPYDALYWVPSRWRPAVWASVRQLDRRLPLGRLVAVAHLGLWLFCVRGVSPAFITTYLTLIFTGQVAACAVLGTPSAAPRPFQRALQSVGDWIGTRTFVNLRWFGPHMGSLALVVLFGTTYGWAWVATWAAVHVGLSGAAATAVTLATEGRMRPAA